MKYYIYLKFYGVLLVLGLFPITLALALLKAFCAITPKLLELTPRDWPHTQTFLALLVSAILIVYLILSKKGLNGMEQYVKITTKVFYHVISHEELEKMFVEKDKTGK